LLGGPGHIGSLNNYEQLEMEKEQMKEEAA
jgi:hypothetical protein